MKKASILIIVLIVMSIPLQTSCAQTNSCPANNKKAEKELREYLAKERNIKSLEKNYSTAISDNAKENIQSLSGEKSKEECQQLRLNLEWLEDQEHYSIYKVADLYFIVLYSFTEEGDFQIDEIPIVNSEFEAIGSIIDFGGSE